MRWIYLVLLVALFSGCDLFDSKEEKAQKKLEQKMKFEKEVAQTKEVQLKKLSAQTQKELAILNSKKELAEIEKQKEIETIRLHTELEKQKILLKRENNQAIFDQKIREEEQRNSQELMRYVILSATLLLALLLYFGFVYYKKRREDKLRAYNDNLAKYMQAKENEARMKIAEKMLDAISSGKLDKSQENQLIGAFSGETTSSYQEQLALTQSDDTQDAEIIETDEKK